MRLIGYIRVSTDEQARNGHSLAVQDAALHKYCDLFGHDLVDVIIDDGVSAGTELAKRPGGAQLMDRLRDGDADGVVFTDLDRVFRRTVDGLLTAEWFDRRGLGIHAVYEHIDTSDPDGWFILTIKLAGAERERRKTIQRNTRVSAGLKADGKVYGHTPYGCTRVGDCLFKDPATWPVRERIVAMKESQDLSLRAICTELQARDIAAPSGGRLWHVSTLLGILNGHHDLNHIPDLPATPETPDSARGAS